LADFQSFVYTSIEGDLCYRHMVVWISIY